MILLVLSCAGATLLRTRWLASNMGGRSAITFLGLSVIVIMIAAWLQWHNIKLSALMVKIKLLTRRSDMPRRIELCQAALALVDRDTSPSIWAVLKMNLAQSLSKNPQGSRAENIEQAICHYREAQNVYTRDAFPEQWAQTMINLGALMAVRIRGERADNIEQAIGYHEQALEIRTRQTLSEEWANTIDHLAIAYRNRSCGERADNLEQAIDYHKQALGIRTRETLSFSWATTQNNLALAYLERIRGERADNLKQAIYHCEQALQVLTVDAFPFEWAITQNNLATAYSNRIRGKRADNLEQAIDCYQQALQVYTYEAFPEQWAVTMDNLATAYSNRIREERAENIEQAIDYYQQALLVTTREAFPEKWAAIQNHLANAYYQRISGERALNQEQAILHAKQALKVYTPTSFPQNCRDTAYLLGRLLYEEERFSSARQAFQTAHQAVEALRDKVTREGAKKKLAQENADLYTRLVFCCLHEGDKEAAFQYAAAGKGRVFVDLLASARFDLSTMTAEDEAFAKDWQQYEEVRQEIDNLRHLLGSALTDDDMTVLLMERHFGVLDDPGKLFDNILEYFMNTIVFIYKILFFSENDHLLNGEQAIREKADQKWDRKEVRAKLSEELSAKQKEALELWEELSYNYPALGATQSAPSLSLEQAQQVATELDATLVEYFPHAKGWSAFVVTKDELRHVPLDGMDEEFWNTMVVDWFNKLGNPRLHTNESYYTLFEWYDVLIAPLELPEKGRLLLAPANVLHLIPLAIARHPESETYLYEQYDLSFASNLSMVRVTLAEAKKATDTTTGTLLTVAYPSTGERHLEAVIPEASAVASRFSQPTKLYNQQATPKAVIEHAPQKEVVHFSCHAGFDPEHPTESGFELFESYLTVQQIITQLRLKETRLATLSACQTHIAMPEAGDELTGLTQALMVAGAKSVVASLWSVEQDSTRILFEHFYQAIAKGEAPTIALKQAMQHVRQQPGWEHPYYWAGFQVSGLGF